MKLDRCKIMNFRSIKELDFKFDDSFQCLVGLNEAGKSNILKALSFLGNDSVPTSLDIRFPDHEDKPIEESYVWFIFTLETSEQKEILKKMEKLFEHVDINEKLIKFKSSKSLSLQEVCHDRKEGLYCVDVMKQSKSSSYWSAYSNWEMIGKWKEIPANWPNRSSLSNPTAKFIDASNDEALINDAQLISIDSKRINKEIGSLITEMIDLKLPKCINWKYETDYLLPGMIQTDGFVARPSSCQPLKNMFELAEFDDASLAITTASKNDPQFGIRNLLRRVSKRATDHLHQVWPEYNKLKIVLMENGPNIQAFIEDKSNTYSLDRRSDGFKRFLTFLLMISVKAKASTLTDALVIIDEPDIALHPSGAVFLRKELMEISRKNNVVIATHSIFMIDKDRVDRNIIVKKEGECTQIVSAYSPSMLDEEVIYKALGYSLYDLLKAKNIIFEGWTDKFTFKKWIDHAIKKRKYKNWQNIGLVHSIGSKDVGRVANDLENLDRKYLIVTDCDQPSLDAKKRFTGKGKWVTYRDLGFTDQETIEDFIDKNLIVKGIAKAAQNKGFSSPSNLQVATCFNKMISMCGEQYGLKNDDLKSFSKFAKNEIFENLEASQIQIEGIIDKIDLSDI